MCTLSQPKPSLSGVSGGAPQRDRRSARWRRNTAGVRSARTYSRRRAPVRSSRAVAEAHAVAVPAPPLRAGCCPTLPAQAPRAALLQSTNLAVLLVLLLQLLSCIGTAAQILVEMAKIASDTIICLHGRLRMFTDCV